jgi:hypothetical protein
MWHGVVSALLIGTAVGIGLEGPTLEAASARALELQIQQVKAKDECGRSIEEWGHDTMTLAAVTVQAGEARIRTLALGKFGHDGSTRNFSPPKSFLSYAVKPGVEQRFQAYLILAERDASGGFGDYLKKFAERVPAGLSAPSRNAGGAKLDAQAAGEAAAAALMTGLTAGTAASIGKQVLAELGARLKDDIFSSYLEEIVVAADGSFNQAKLKPQTQSFRATGCTYTVTYRWASRP